MFLKRLFGGRKPPLTLVDPVFGSITYSKADGWSNDHFQGLGDHEAQLLIDAGSAGPSQKQRDAFRALVSREDNRLERAKGAVLKLRGEMNLPASDPWVSGVTIPTLGPEPRGSLWTVWYDSEQDDVFMFGIQTQDWVEFSAFADD